MMDVDVYIKKWYSDLKLVENMACSLSDLNEDCLLEISDRLNFLDLNNFVTVTGTKRALIKRCENLHIGRYAWHSYVNKHQYGYTYFIKTVNNDDSSGIRLTYYELLRFLDIVGPYVKVLRLFHIEHTTNIIINKCKNICELLMDECDASRRLKINQFPYLERLESETCSGIFGPCALFSFENLSQIKDLCISTTSVPLYPDDFKYATNLRKFKVCIYKRCMRMMKPVIETIINTNAETLQEVQIYVTDGSPLMNLQLNLKESAAVGVVRFYVYSP